MNSAADDLRINAIRFLAVDAVQQANSGHPGLPLGAAAAAYTLWTRHLRFNPRDPQWFDRDRFVLSAGHGSALLYALLHLTGYDLTLDDLRAFRQLGSRTPGHPEYHHTPGVEVTTGPLGQGFANAVGMAMAEAHLGAVYTRDETIAAIAARAAEVDVIGADIDAYADKVRNVADAGIFGPDLLRRVISDRITAWGVADEPALRQFVIS